MRGRPPIKDLSGKRFGILTVISLHPKIELGKSRKWVCKCDCGNVVLCFRNNLPRGNSKSCGCVGRAKSAARMAVFARKHGGCGTSLFKTWDSIKQRTTNPNDKGFKNYGARGIRMCEEWLDFEVFAKDVGERPGPEYSLDRYPDNDGNYEPGNVRWATRTEQLRNRRVSVYVLVNGEALFSEDAAAKLGISSAAVRIRAAKGQLQRVPLSSIRRTA